MKQKIYAAFNNLDDAKLAMGSIKKENLNQANLKVIFLTDQTGKDFQKDHYEFGEEFFPPNIPTNSHLVWPGVKVVNILGLGKVQIAVNTPLPHERNFGSELVDEDLKIVEPEVKAQKIVAIIEAETDLIPKFKFILQSNGAEII